MWVTSDLWDEATGTATFEWLDWSGNRLSVKTPASVQCTVGAINSTKVLQTNTENILNGFDTTNAVLRMQVQATGQRPNSNSKETFRHEHYWSAVPLNKAQLVDPGLQLSYSKANECFKVSATTGVAAWVWLDYPDGAVVSFDSNAFWLAPGEARQVTYKVKNDTTNGTWIDGVTVQSMWNQTLPY